jgi:CDP-diacylglycerol--glycerol-3-phosphate 3-phosphatidyltransferase
MLRQVPNALTSLRIAAVPYLAWLAASGSEQAFAMVLVGCLISDAVDGMLARALHATSRLGAQLDSIGDTLLFFLAVAGVFVFHADAVAAHPALFAIVPAAWLAENLVALARYGRLSSFHTVLSRAAAIAMSLFVVVLFTAGFRPLLLYVAATVLIAATVEEFVLMWLLPEWTANVGGLFWILRQRRSVARD